MQVVKNYGSRDAGTNPHHAAWRSQSQVPLCCLLCFCLHSRLLSPVEIPFAGWEPKELQGYLVVEQSPVHGGFLGSLTYNPTSIWAEVQRNEHKKGLVLAPLSHSQAETAVARGMCCLQDSPWDLLNWRSPSPGSPFPPVGVWVGTCSNRMY